MHYPTKRNKDGIPVINMESLTCEEILEYVNHHVYQYASLGASISYEAFIEQLDTDSRKEIFEEFYKRSQRIIALKPEIDKWFHENQDS